MGNVLITHATQYAAPGALPILLREGMQLLCHDAAFDNAKAARAFEKAHPGAIALTGQTPEELVAELSLKKIGIDAVVSNDVFPNTPRAIEDISMETLRNGFEALLVFPFRLTQLLLPAMKRKKSGRLVFVTSARHLQPESGFAVATSIRAGTTAFALALAREAAPFGIQVNVVAPNYLYSEAYYPKARFIDDPAGREQIAAKVPMGRLGRPEEIGELIAFLVSGRSPFMTGQVVHFTGGWP
jgi:NAD(P)-dependent dehydrogenase (short-subunit alcohol dehydrogenase family)